jgi:hypothetical protein
VSKGGISLKELSEMPYSQYKIVRKAAELDEIRQRQAFISDSNAAFFGNKKHIQKLEQVYNSVSGSQVEWKADSDWKSRAMRFKR